MIKKKISDIAKKQGIEVFGYNSNAFVGLFPYYVKENGNISLYARSIDYHKVIKEKLMPIKECFESCGAKNVIIHCDNGEYNDRDAAFRAGLGFYGKNNLLINEKYGSYFFIGQVIHNLPIGKDCPVDTKCFECNKCLENCITGTLYKSYNKYDCLSDITQRKGELAEEEKQFIINGGLCWGCDKCQMVCPYNEKLDNTAIPEFLDKRISSLSISDLENISEREFKRKYGDYAFAWRGGKVIKRNLDILRNADEEK